MNHNAVGLSHKNPSNAHSCSDLWLTEYDDHQFSSRRRLWPHVSQVLCLFEHFFLLPADLAELGEDHAEGQADAVVCVVGKMLPWIHLGTVQNTFQLVGVVEVAVED